MSGEEVFHINLKGMIFAYIITLGVAIITLRGRFLPPYKGRRLWKWMRVGAIRGFWAFLSTSLFIVAIELLLNFLYKGAQLSSSPLAFFFVSRDINLVFLLVIVFAPIYEEITFRGGFYRFFRRYMSIFPALMLAAALFAIVHPENPIAMSVLFLLGSVLSLTYEYSDNIVASVTYHALWNALTFFLTLLQL